MKTSRYCKLDAVRGIALLNMIAYHAIWDLVYLYNFKWEWYWSEWGYIWQQGICWTFIFLSGFCLPLGKRSIKRGIIVFVCGAIITIVTLVFMPNNKIIFGVLTLIGSCIILVSVFDKWLKKLPPIFGMLTSFVLFCVTRNINNGWLGFERFNLLKMPEIHCSNMFTIYIGLQDESFKSADYFSLFPWLFLFLSGYFLFRYLEKREALGIFEKSVFPSVEWLGRHSLIIYMLHQPIIYLFFELIL